MCMSTCMASKKILNPLKNKGTSKLTNLHSFRVFTCDCKINTKLVYLGMNSQMIYYWIVTLNSNMKWEHRSFMGENKITHLHDNWHRLDISQQLFKRDPPPLIQFWRFTTLCSKCQQQNWQIVTHKELDLENTTNNLCSGYQVLRMATVFKEHLCLREINHCITKKIHLDWPSELNVPTSWANWIEEYWYNAIKT